MSSSEQNLAAYFAEATAWDVDRMAQVQHGARVARITALAAVVCAIASSLALALLMPLKRVEPFVIRVDNSTGIVDVVPTYVGQLQSTDSVTRYFLSHYVSICERFNFSTAESDYEECSAFHNARRNQAWYARWNRNNPLSPLNVHKDGSIVAVQVTAVSFLPRASGVSDTAQVRYLKIDRAGVGAQDAISHWIATVQYAYGAPASDATVRRWNPLGFRVVEFVSESESPMGRAP
jgi:type IV secretion system protein VirB8